MAKHFVYVGEYLPDPEDGGFAVPSLAYAMAHGNIDRHFSCDDAGYQFPESDFTPEDNEHVQICDGEDKFRESDGHPYTVFEYHDVLSLSEAIALLGDGPNAHVVHGRMCFDDDGKPVKLVLMIFWKETI